MAEVTLETSTSGAESDELKSLTWTREVRIRRRICGFRSRGVRSSLRAPDWSGNAENLSVSDSVSPHTLLRHNAQPEFVRAAQRFRFVASPKEFGFLKAGESPKT